VRIRVKPLKQKSLLKYFARDFQDLFPFKKDILIQKQFGVKITFRLMNMNMTFLYGESTPWDRKRYGINDICSKFKGK
jgi:hypothetical protein